MMKGDVVRVVVADDHRLFREGMRALLAEVPEVALVGEAETGLEVVAIVEEVVPDVVLMDLHMPDMDGVEATKRVLQIQPDLGVVMVTMMADDVSVFSAMRAGARGYVLKGDSPEALLQTVLLVADGQAVFGPKIAERITNFFQSLARIHERSNPREPFPELTPREREVLDWIAQGKSNREIQAGLVLSESTVRNHITRVFSKLRVADRAQAIVRAREAGMG